MFSISYLCRRIRPEKLVVLNVDSFSVACFVHQISPTKTISTAFFSRLWCDVRLKQFQEAASYSWWPRSNLDQRDWWRLIPGCWVLLNYCGPGWRRETESREKWRLSAQLWPTALSSCPTGRHGRTTWWQNREEHTMQVTMCKNKTKHCTAQNVQQSHRLKKKMYCSFCCCSLVPSCCV